MIQLPTHSGKFRMLTQVPVGGQARVAVLEGLSTSQCERLQAYGLAPGNWVSVVQHSPVTVVQVEHTELAFEAEIACHVKMEL